MIPTAAVLDTSVIVKWFRQGEVLAQPALALRMGHLEGHLSIAVPTLAIYELSNVLCYKHDLKTEQVQEAAQSLLDMGLDWIVPSSGLVRRAIALAREYAITVYDATFVAGADTLGISLITADERLARRLASLSYVQYLGDVEE